VAIETQGGTRRDFGRLTSSSGAKANAEIVDGSAAVRRLHRGCSRRTTEYSTMKSNLAAIPLMTLVCMLGATGCTSNVDDDAPSSVLSTKEEPAKGDEAELGKSTQAMTWCGSQYNSCGIIDQRAYGMNMYCWESSRDYLSSYMFVCNGTSSFRFLYRRGLTCRDCAAGSGGCIVRTTYDVCDSSR